MVGVGKLLQMGLGFVLLAGACGADEPAVLDETWMLGTFSNRAIGCSENDIVTRYTFDEAGTVAIVKEGGGATYSEWSALWEQREPDRVRMMRDEASASVEFYPIDEGMELEVTRSNECVQEAIGSYVRHEIHAVDLDTGERMEYGNMTPGAMCPTIDDQVCSDTYIVWCDEALAKCNQDG